MDANWPLRNCTVIALVAIRWFPDLPRHLCCLPLSWNSGGFPRKATAGMSYDLCGFEWGHSHNLLVTIANGARDWAGLDGVKW